MDVHKSTETRVVIGPNAKSQKYCPVAMRDCLEVESAPDSRTASRLVTDCREMSRRLEETENTLIPDGACGALLLASLTEGTLAKYTQEGASHA
jgi:hypothetical protein